MKFVEIQFILDGLVSTVQEYVRDCNHNLEAERYNKKYREYFAQYIWQPVRLSKIDLYVFS